MRYEFKPIGQCNMCGSTQRDLLGMRLSASQGFRPRNAEGIAVPVKRCGNCGLIYSDPLPIPENMSDHYGVPAEDYWGREALSWSPAYFSREIATAKALIDFAPGMKALDIGSGLGKAMRSLSAAGFDTYGLEPSVPFRTKSIELMDIPADRIQLAPIEDAQYAPDTFDFITFGAVLEHVYDPKAAIERAMGWLKPGGVLQAEVPSSDYLLSKLVNFFFRARGTNYVTHISPMHSPFHLYEFTLRSFADYDVAKHWYEVCSIYHVPKAFHAPLRWWMERRKTGMQLTVFLRKA